MTHLPPSYGDDSRSTRRKTETPGPTLQGDSNLLSSTSLGAPPMDVIMSCYAPAELTLKGVSYEDACRVIGETIAPEDDFALTAAQLKSFVELTRRGQSLNHTDLGELASESGDLIIRQLTTLRSESRKLLSESSVEFSLAALYARECSIEVAPGESPDLCDLTVDWGLSLDYQSDYSLEERWDLLQQILLVAGEIDTATCRTRTLDTAIKRFQLEDRATIEVVARDTLTASPTTDPHLSQRPDLIPFCALHLYDKEEVDPLIDLGQRFMQIHAELSKVCGGVRNEFNLEEAVVSRSQLEQLGDAPFLWNSDTNVLVISVEHYLLVVTRASTGNTLLEDLEALERYAAKILHEDTVPTPGALKMIQATETSESDLSPIFRTLGLPSQDYFVAALRQFVASEDPKAAVIIRDGLLDSVIAGAAVTVELSRIYTIEGSDPGALVGFTEEEGEASGEPEDAIEEEAAATNEYEDEAADAWASPETLVEVTRSVIVAGGSRSALGVSPVVGFAPAEHLTVSDDIPPNGDPQFYLTVSVGPGEARVLPTEIAATTLRYLGIDPADLSMIESRPDPTSGDREGYLSPSVRVLY